MGWWWTSDPQTPVLQPSDPTPDPQPASPRELSDKPFHTSDADHAHQQPARTLPKRAAPISRDELAEADLARLLSEVSSSSSSSSTPPPRSRITTVPTTTPLSSPSPSPIDDLNPSQRHLPSTPPSTTATATATDDFESSLLPKELSCRALFDSAFYCQSLGGQFQSVYRHGAFRSCADHWADFWFCMRTKSYPADQKQELVRQHYREKEERLRRRPNSEDVWERRGGRLEGAFARDPDAEGVFERVLYGRGAGKEQLGVEPSVDS